MGSDAVEEVEFPLTLNSFKVHRLMCSQLMKLAERITVMFPQIEASRPRCSSGIQSLVSLNNALDRAKQLLQYCSESSKLYLVITGEPIVARFLRSRKLMVQSLSQIQTMVPTVLAAEISPIIDDLEEANFVMEPSEEDARKVLLKLLHTGTDSEESQMRALQVALSKLHIISKRDFVIEVRSIKKLLEIVGDNNPNKAKILKTLLYLLKKYKNSVSVYHRSSSNGVRGGMPIDSSNDQLNEAVKHDEGQPNLLSHAAPPEEFRCPISRRVMYDPVIIASGQTYERMWIQKWFNDGNDTCPKTKLKLDNFSIIPNAGMKGLISKWCLDYGISISEPMTQPCQSLDLSTDSITSFSSALNDLQLQMDISSLSFGSLEASFISDASSTKVVEGSRLKLMDRHDRLDTCECRTNTYKSDVELLSQLSELPWESQCTIIQDIISHMQCDCQVWDSESCGKLIEPVVVLLRVALEQCDLGAQKAGSKLLLALLNKTGSGSSSYLNEDAYSLLASFLKSETVEESLTILETLSAHPKCRSKIAASGAPASLLNIFDLENKELHERVIRILCNLSSNIDICSKLTSFGCIPKLVPFINDSNVTRHCIVLLKNLCDSEEARVSVAETNGCIPSIAQLLESDSHEEQEHAVSILLSLCAQRVQYCHLLMDEGVIPSLCSISVNGNEKGKVSALELLRQLRDIECEPDPESPPPCFNVVEEEEEVVVVPQGKVRKSGFLRNLAGSLTSRRKRS